MRKIIFTFLILLTACTSRQNLTPTPFSASETPFSSSPSPSSVSPEDRVNILSSLEYDKKCPHGCWLGINPGVTTENEAMSILKASAEIEQDSYVQYDDYTYMKWFMEKTPGYEFPIQIVFENNLVQRIYITNIIPVSISDLFKIFGEPSEINITYELPPDTPRFVRYSVYYPQQRIQIDVAPAFWNEPVPYDLVRNLSLNVEYHPVSTISAALQPWLGFGHLKDYLPGIEIPTGQYSITP